MIIIDENIGLTQLFLDKEIVFVDSILIAFLKLAPPRML